MLSMATEGLRYSLEASFPLIHLASRGRRQRQRKAIWEVEFRDKGGPPVDLRVCWERLC